MAASSIDAALASTVASIFIINGKHGLITFYPSSSRVYFIPNRPGNEGATHDSKAPVYDTPDVLLLANRIRLNHNVYEYEHTSLLVSTVLLSRRYKPGTRITIGA